MTLLLIIGDHNMKLSQKILRPLIIILFLAFVWQATIFLFHIPNYFLPSLFEVIKTLFNQYHIILLATKTTLLEAFLGFALAFFFATISALVFFRYRALGFLFWPILLISQALPTLAIAPLLVLWLGYGLSSKIALVAIMLFFPIASAFLDGLKNSPNAWIEMANLMTKNSWRILWHIRVPAALPHLASGVRIAAAGAMMGAVIGEWIGANQGLGFLLLEANSRFQTDMVFAVIVVLIILSLAIYWGLDYCLMKLTF